MEALSNASSIIAEGEVAQLVQLKQRRMICDEEYIRVIRAKTAELFSAACRVGAIVSDRKDSDIAEIGDFGIVFGSAFQIVDDVLDYFGEKESIGKNVGDDFFEGKVTLPLIILFNLAEDREKAQLLDLIAREERSESDLLRVKELLELYQVKAAIRELLSSYLYKAKKLLNNLKADDRYKDYLIRLFEVTLVNNKYLF
jgi:octaprenyl-diphosphate synthase